MVFACPGYPEESALHSGHPVRQKRANMPALQKGLQVRGTKSAKWKLKKLRERGSRYVIAVDYTATKALVSHYEVGTLYVLGDLAGVRKTTEQVHIRQHYVTVSWYCYEFCKMPEYEVLLIGFCVITAAPAYTSQDCPICGDRVREDRDRKRHEFQCRKCGYRSDGGQIGVTNLYLAAPESVSTQRFDFVGIRNGSSSGQQGSVR